MKNKIAFSAILILVLAIVLQQAYAEKPIPNEKSFDIEDYAWLAGHWTGDGFGGTSEEVWTKPQNGVMMGMYRHHDKNGKLVFYEFLTLDKDGMKLKHFYPNMTGWETKEEFVTFEMVNATPNKLVLKGLVFEKKSDTEMEISLKMNRGGKVETEVFHMRRVSL